jgi:hypothetical protein
MNEESYITERVEHQILWYDTKSVFNKKMYYLFKTVEIVAATSIPLVSDFIFMDVKVVSVLGVLVAIIASLLGIYKFHENWINYRTTAETLKHNKHLFLTKTGPYSDNDAFEKLVESIESLISKENSNWLSMFNKKNNRNKKD